MTSTPGWPLRIESLRDPDQDGVAARQAGLAAAVRHLHRAVLRAFPATGGAPHRDDIPGREGLERDAAFRTLRDVDLVHLDTDGNVAVAYPFSGRPTGHKVQLDHGAMLQAMCAIDALGIPLMTGQNGVINSVDPGDGHPIRIQRRAGSWRWSPEGIAVLVAQRNGAGPAADCLCSTRSPPARTAACWARFIPRTCDPLRDGLVREGAGHGPRPSTEQSISNIRCANLRP